MLTIQSAVKKQKQWIYLQAKSTVQDFKLAVLSEESLIDNNKSIAETVDVLEKI